MIELFSLLVLGFAAYRLTRIFIIDTIFSGFRAKFHFFLANKAEKGEKLSMFWEKLLEMTSCTFCFGMYASLAIYSLFLWEYPWDFGRLDWISVAAIAGVQSMIHALEPEE